MLPPRFDGQHIRFEVSVQTAILTRTQSGPFNAFYVFNAFRAETETANARLQFSPKKQPAME